MLAPEQLHYALALCRTPEVGSQIGGRLLQLFPDLSDLFKASTEQLQQLSLPDAAITAIRSPDWNGVDKDLAWADKPNHHIIHYQDPYYPKLLKETNGAPFLLFVRGQLDVLNQPQLAIVGSRNPSVLGLELARGFAYSLSKAGLVITSGLALGIDGASHQAVIERGNRTIAVMGAGLDTIYPRRHLQLAEQITEHGALITEFPTGVRPLPQHFPQRNRIISGLSVGVLVVEATLRSGSLITARLATEQGREVFALPGSVHSPLARGCHYLIQQGAKLVETTNDILEELGPLVSIVMEADQITHSRKYLQTLDKNHLKLLECIEFAPTSIDTLVERSGFKIAQAVSMLLILELKGCISRIAGGYQRV